MHVKTTLNIRNDLQRVAPLLRDGATGASHPKLSQASATVMQAIIDTNERIDAMVRTPSQPG